MGFLLKFSHTIDRFVSIFGKAGAWGLILMMLVIVADVLLRHWFVIGSTQLQELEWHFHGIVFLLGLGWAYSQNAHVRIELVSERLSPRAQAWIEVFGILLLLLPYVTALYLFSADYAAISLEYNEGSASPNGLPARYVIKYCIVLGVFLLGLSAISRLFKAIVYLFGPEVLAAQTPFKIAHQQEGAS
ncbi:C4-dicarboxylate ABC transporter [Kordiimonas sediminis]|uniref:TRAP transporter small permease protein n=1 Tax=Kordiimonas sediminis TaxID=1735581 RepID=A0A919E950_9PROT|nr:TRAP transporter small permease subunit [Kordiimonas sediminis]GHF26255.1 C4-dicarboxylate ABC transporter [Kordiimonas sediminis]